MSNITDTPVDTGGVILRQDAIAYDDVTVNFAGADTYAMGTIMAYNTATSKYVPFAIGGANGTGTPVTVLTYALSRTTAGDSVARLPIHGTMNRNRLIVHADGDDSNLTRDHLDVLHARGILTQKVNQLSPA